MKVYELMNALSDLPSGAEVFCSAALSIKDIGDSLECGRDENGNTIYAVSKRLDFVDGDGENMVSLNF